MVLDLTRETGEICEALGIDQRDVGRGERMRLAMALIVIADRAAHAEQQRIIGIVQRHAARPMDLVAEIQEAAAMTPLAAIHVKKKALGLDDDTYRDLLERVTGKRSAGEMDHGERLKVVAEMDRQGAMGAPAKGRSTGVQRPALAGPFAKKLQALWIAGWNLGLIRNRDDAAMLAFVERQTGIESTRFLVDAADARKAVEALKKWLERGGVVWGTSSGTDFLTHDQGKVAWAQFRLLWPGATLTGNRRDFHREVMRYVAEPYGGKPLGTVTPAEWRAVMNALGERIRAARKGDAS